MRTVIRQRPCNSLDDISHQLREAFLALRQAIEAENPVVIVVSAPDLLGQDSLEGAALATGLVGLMRAATFEGSSKGWHVTVLAIDPEAEPPAEMLDIATQNGSLNGQILNLGSGHFGKIVP